MIAFAGAALMETQPAIGTRELLQHVASRTYNAIRDLAIDCIGNHVVVTGHCRSYYQKQLVTQAILAAEPNVTLQNAVAVCPG